MMHSPLMGLLCKISWVITAVYCANVLTAMHGFDVLAMGPLASMHHAVMYVVGAAGIFSLVTLVLSMVSGSDGSCSCGK